VSNENPIGSDAARIDARPTSDGAHGGDYQRLTGAAAASPRVLFGGTPYCDYAVTIEQITVEVIMHGPDALAGAVVSGDRIEEALNDCPNPPAPPNRLVLDERGGEVTSDAAGRFMPALTGVESNSPVVDGALVITRSDAGAMSAAMQWTRTDQAPPLAWVVALANPVTLEPRACVIGDHYCVGSGELGTLYQCVDGSSLDEVQRCASGCTPVTQPVGEHTDESCR
jgi:hypothetical protein